MEDEILYVFLVILFIAGALVLIPEVNSLDTSTWTFTGASFLSSLISNFPVVYLAVAVGILAVIIMERHR